MRSLTPTSLPAVALPLLVIVMTACGGPGGASDRTPPPVTSPEAVASLVPHDAPSSAPSPAGEPTPAPTASAEPATSPTSAPTPTPKPVPVPTTWSTLATVLKGSCWSPTATIDAVGRFHVAATCDGVIRYAVSDDGRTWKTAHFALPARRQDVTPQLAVDGSTLYLAYTRLRVTDGGCGDDGLVDVGIYYRTRHLPSGTWSAPIRLGSAGDHLMAFRVKDGVIHETFTSDDGKGPVAYGRSDHGRFLSVVLPHSADTSLRVGDDARARIAYTTGGALRYATIAKDGRMDSRSIYRSSVMQLTSPSLVLGQDDRPYIAFTAHERWTSGGCADGSAPVPQPGTYFATEDHGAWAIRRISRIISNPSVLVDVQTGSVEVVVSYEKGIRHLTRQADGAWSGRLLPGTLGMDEALVRLDPLTGRLLVIAARWGDGEPTIVALVKR